MKLRRLYSNLPKVFPEIQFHDGLNVIFGGCRGARRPDAGLAQSRQIDSASDH